MKRRVRPETLAGVRGKCGGLLAHPSFWFVKMRTATPQGGRGCRKHTQAVELRGVAREELCERGHVLL